MIISTNLENAFDEVQYPPMIKALEILGEGTPVNMVKALHDKYIANIILTGKNWEYFPKVWDEERMPP